MNAEQWAAADSVSSPQSPGVGKENDEKKSNNKKLYNEP